MSAVMGPPGSVEGAGVKLEWVAVEGAPYICPSDNLAVIIAMTISGTDEEREARKHLIAAAPAMLKALRAMVLNDTHTYRDCHKAALAAIAKAIGDGSHDESTPDNRRLAEIEGERDAYRAGVIEALAKLDTWVMGSAFTKPKAGQIILRVESVTRLIETLRALIQGVPLGDGAQDASTLGNSGMQNSNQDGEA